jgi:hypothetical protein
VNGVVRLGGTILVGVASGLLGATIFSSASSGASLEHKQRGLASPKPTVDEGEESCEPAPRQPARGPTVGQAASSDPNDDESSPAPPESFAPQDTVEGQIEIERQKSENRLMSHKQERRDAGWADEMEGSITEAMTARSDLLTGTFSNVECRSVSCTMRIDWQDIETANREAPSLIVDLGNDVPCVRMLTMDDDRQGNLEPSGTVFVDCEMVRYPDQQIDGPSE